MVVAVAGGFILGRDQLAKAFLPISIVQMNRPHPTPLLTPDEASRVARDEASPVWREGVKSTDVPKLDPSDYAAERSKNYVFSSTRRHRGLRYRHAPKSLPSDENDTDNADDSATTPSDSPSGADDNGPSPSPTPPPTSTNNGMN